MMVISNRLKRPLDNLIDIMQSAFLRERNISDNVRYHMGMAARLRELGLPGNLASSDLAKAYDTNHCKLLFRTMDEMGFRVNGVIRWCRILKAGSTACVRMNGALSAQFPVENGLSQGGPVSVDEWTIVFQPLMAYMQSLQAKGRLPTLPLPWRAARELQLQPWEPTLMTLRPFSATSMPRAWLSRRPLTSTRRLEGRLCQSPRLAFST